MGNYWLDVEKLKCQEDLMETHKRLSGRELLRSDPWRALPQTFTGDLREYQNRILNATTPICEVHEETFVDEEFGEMDRFVIREVGQITTRNLMRQVWNKMFFDSELMNMPPLPEEGMISSEWRSVDERRNEIHRSKESMARCKAAQTTAEEHPLTQDEQNGREEWRDG